MSNFIVFTSLYVCVCVYVCVCACACVADWTFDSLSTMSALTDTHAVEGE